MFHYYDMKCSKCNGTQVLDVSDGGVQSCEYATEEYLGFKIQLVPGKIYRITDGCGQVYSLSKYIGLIEKGVEILFLFEKLNGENRYRYSAGTFSVRCYGNEAHVEFRARLHGHTIQELSIGGVHNIWKPHWMSSPGQFEGHDI